MRLINFSKGLGECLQDEPQGVEEYDYPELPPGAMYDSDHQCRLQFSVTATVCSPLDEICSRLWCMINNTCTTQLRPAAPGTFCGKHKVRTTIPPHVSLFALKPIISSCPIRFFLLSTFLPSQFFL